MTRRAVRVLICAVLLLALCVLPAAAEDETQPALSMPPEYCAVPDYLPGDVTDFLPEGLFSTDPAEAAEALSDVTRFSVLLSTLLSCLGLRLADASCMLSVLIGLLLLGTVLRRVSGALGGQADKVSGFLMRLSLFGTAAGMTAGLAGTVTAYFRQLTSLTAGFIPVIGTLYAIGGNVTQAAAGQGLLVVFLAVIDLLCTKPAPGICGVCMALSLFDVIGTRIRPGALSERIRKTYAGLLGFAMFLLSALLGTQTLLSAGRDTIRMKGLRYAVSQMIPVAGGAVSASLNTISAGVTVLRRITGTSGILLLGLLLLPTLIELLLMRQVLLWSSSAAEMLDCPEESRLLGEIAGLYGYMAAAAAVSSVFFTLSLALLASCAGVL